MTAFVVSNTSLEAACAITGGQFNVPLSATGQEPATHFGCNWVSYPAEIADALTAPDGVAVG